MFEIQHINKPINKQRVHLNRLVKVAVREIFPDVSLDEQTVNLSNSQKIDVTHENVDNEKDFWKLTVQLLLRFNKYVQCCLNKIKDETLQLAWLINDIEILVPELRRYFLQIVYPKLSYESLNGCFEGAIRNMLDFLLEIPIISANIIVKILSEKCTSHLKLISSIPQRFRKTNREIPSKPSPYASLVLSPLTEFFSETSSILSLKWCKYCEIEVTDGIMKQCIVLMEDVLTSIKKMEDSLKILKRARDKPTGLSSGAITDDDKIRRQLAIDVNYFEQLVLKSGMKVNDLAKFKELKELVTSAERNNHYC
ncbi:conserved oligomeric Golgi complex subunit 2 [Caerostris extrusa]|uniref:Conserved oligomeric Golgi complex subunit 2 n=1 Tax=Caerostris extrusa TaxID=172846 RepID=A0AAV4R4S8_CAEEX|nr:conserved oligomeric Golgi complex subunit 2 [Caerostris extrusa]